MALTTVTTTFDLADYFGTDFNARRTKAWATNTAPDQTIHDESTGETRVGAAYATVASDGTGSFAHWAPGVDANPATWQTYYHFDVPDRAASGGRRTLTLGPFTVTASGELTALVEEQIATPTQSASDYADAAEAAQAAAEAARDDAVDISNISTSDGVVEALVLNTGGAGPLTSAALAATFVSQSRRAMNLRDVVTPSGVNDTAAVNAALAAFDAAGGGVLRIPRDDWVFTGATGLALTGTSNPIHIIADDGVVFDMTGSTATYGLQLGGSVTATSAALGADVAKGADAITCALAVSAGDVVKISSTDLFETLAGTVKGEFAEVLSAVGGTITLKAGLWDSYTAATTTVTLMEMPRVTVEGLTILRNSNHIGLEVYAARDVLLGGLHSQGARLTLFEFDHVFGGTADNLTGTDFWYSGSGNSYGLVVGASQHVKEIGLDLRGGRHAIAHGGSLPTRDVQTIGGTFDSHHLSDMAAFDYHGNVESASIIGATILNGMNIQGSNIYVGAGTRVRGFDRQAIEIGPARSCDYIKIEGADIESVSGQDGIAYLPRNGATATTLGLLKIDATVRAGAAALNLTPPSAAHTGATISRLVVRGDLRAGGNSSAVNAALSTAAYVGITEAEFDGRFSSSGTSACLNLQSTSTGPVSFRGHYQSDGTARAVDCRMFGDITVRPGTTFKAPAANPRNLLWGAGAVRIHGLHVDGGATAGGLDCGTGPTEALVSNVTRVNTTGNPTLPARHYSRVNAIGKVTTYGTAAPAAGAWNVGDRCENTAPAVGSAKAWACTVAGTPGTWVSEGNL